MTVLEDRLRVELAELADALAENEVHRADVELARPVENPTISRRRVLVGVGALAAIGLGGLWASGINQTGPGVLTTAAASIDVGSWSPIAAAPITSRPYAVSGWTGSRAVFWAGSNASRDFAHTDGALYDPATGAWETMNTPGFGHPGLLGLHLNGELFAASKGGIVRIDIESGEEEPIAPPPFQMSAVVETDGDLWAVGSRVDGTISVARHVPAEDRWDSRNDQKSALPALADGLQDQSVVVRALGSEIVLCTPTGMCLAFDTATPPTDGAWRFISGPDVGDVPGITGITEHGLVRLSLTQKDGRGAALHILSGDSWTRLVDVLPVTGFRDTETSVIPAGDWLAILSADQEPIMVHLATGEWGATEWPLTGTQLPNTVWTGEQLIVWGGVQSNTTEAQGAIWTPPTN